MREERTCWKALPLAAQGLPPLILQVAREIPLSLRDCCITSHPGAEKLKTTSPFSPLVSLTVDGAALLVSPGSFKQGSCTGEWSRQGGLELAWGD